MNEEKALDMFNNKLLGSIKYQVNSIKEDMKCLSTICKILKKELK